ncbi:MAG: cytochrome B, partial [Bacteroidota bacterium]
MYDILRHSHSGLRYVVLALLLAAIFKNFLKWQSKAPFTDGDRKLNLFTMTSAHIQLLLGIVMYLISPKVQFNAGMMKDSMLRFFTIEHNLMMLIAIALITIG